LNVTNEISGADSVVADATDESLADLAPALKDLAKIKVPLRRTRNIQSCHPIATAPGTETF